MPSRDATGERLDALHALRGQGVPTVAVLAGAAGLGGRARLRWNEAAGRVVAWETTVGGTGLARTWLAATLSDLPAAAAAWLAGATGEPVDAATDRLARMTLFDLDRLWRELPVDAATPAAVLARAAVAGRVAGRPLDAGTLVTEVAGITHRGWPVAAAAVHAGCELPPSGRRLAGKRHPCRAPPDVDGGHGSRSTGLSGNTTMIAGPSSSSNVTVL